jgi:hypothetical protein
MRWFAKQLNDMNLVAVLAASFLTFFLTARTIKIYFSQLYQDLTPAEEEQELEIKGFDADGA